MGQRCSPTGDGDGRLHSRTCRDRCVVTGFNCGLHDPSLAPQSGGRKRKNSRGKAGGRMSSVVQPLAVPRNPAMALLRDYMELTKLRVTTLIVVTAWCGYFFGARQSG